MEKLTQHVYGVLTSNSFLNGYVIDNGGKLTVVDVGQDASFTDAVLNGIQGIGKRSDDIAQIIITHAHPDHFGGLKALQDRVNVPTYAHRMDALAITGEQPVYFAEPESLNLLDKLVARFVLNMPMPAPCRVDGVLNDGDKLEDVLTGAEVIYLPGHSYGQIGIWLPDEKTLIGGDVAVNLPWGLGMPIKAASPDWREAKASIRRAADLQPQNLLLGHGKPIIGGAAEKLSRLASRLGE